MTKRRCLLAGISVIFLGLILVLVIPPWRHAAFAVFQRDSGQPDAALLPSVDQGSAFWGDSNPDPKLAPGIDFASVRWWNWNDDIVFAVWVDRPRLDGNHGFERLTDRPTEIWRYWLDPQGINLECLTTDGKAASLTVKNERFDLSQGRLILISTVGGQVRVKQLTRDNLNLKAGHGREPPESLVKLRDDAEVRAFFGAARNAGKD